MDLMDYVKNGQVVQGRQAQTVLIDSESDLNMLVQYGYEPGSIAYTAGYTNVWQMGADGAWTAIVGGD